MIGLLLMFVNGCAGSTCGGLKCSRFLVLLKNLYNEFKKQIHPHLLTPVLINNRQLSVSAVHQVLAFCMMYVMLIFVGATLLMLDNNGFISSISIACSAVSNSGPAIGEYATSMASAGIFSKTILCFLMLAGRLEGFTVMVSSHPTSGLDRLGIERDSLSHPYIIENSRDFIQYI